MSLIQAFTITRITQGIRSGGMLVENFAVSRST